jgi:hypothetical protein
MRVIKKTFEQASEHYKLISQYEIDNGYQSEVENGLSSFFLLGQNFPMRDISDFFSAENFSMVESFEEIEASYQLIKYGFYKQSMISLRTSLEIGLLSIYWSIIGKDSSEFKEWLSSKRDTPYKNKKFWNKLKSNENIEEFDKNFNLIEEIKSFSLSDFVHTKGIWFSNFGEFQRKLKGCDKIENFNEWLVNFKNIIRIIGILHLLKFPTLNIKFSTEFLLSKFGTFDNIPQFGAGLGDEMYLTTSFIPENELWFINDLANNNVEVIEIKKWINKLPDLTKKEIKNKIIETQKRNIEMSGFENWNSNVQTYDDRISIEMILALRKWAISENLMNIDCIMAKHRRKASS